MLQNIGLCQSEDSYVSKFMYRNKYLFLCHLLSSRRRKSFPITFYSMPKDKENLHWLDLRQLFRLYFIDGISKYIYTYSSTFLDSFVAQTMKNLPTMQETRFDPWVRKIHWRREWLPTPVFMPGDYHGQRGLAGSSPYGHKESDMTD